MSYSKCELDFLEEVRKKRITFWEYEGDEYMAHVMSLALVSAFAQYPYCSSDISLEHYRESMAAYLKEAAED